MVAVDPWMMWSCPNFSESSGRETPFDPVCGMVRVVAAFAPVFAAREFGVKPVLEAGRGQFARIQTSGQRFKHLEKTSGRVRRENRRSFETRRHGEGLIKSRGVRSHCQR